MASNQATQLDDQFDIVDALYKEATLTLTDAERDALDAEPEVATAKAVVIQSRKPRPRHNPVPIFTRISDLYEEAEATRFIDDDISDDSASIMAAPDKADAVASPDDDFAIPSSFGSTEDDVTLEAEPDFDQDDDAAITKQTNASLTEDDLSLLAEALSDDAPLPDDVTISDEIEPAVALDDVLNGLAADESTAPASDEAAALAALDATRPQADESLTQQLADVKSAVEHAAAVPQDLSDATDDEAPSDDGSDMPLSSSALASFIGETVREVLDEELPHMVRGLVDEALGERQGRYGRSDTPHIGLRTKPSRH